MLMQPHVIGLKGVGKRVVMHIGLQVRLPEAGLAVGQGDGLQTVNKCRILHCGNHVARNADQTQIQRHTRQMPPRLIYLVLFPGLDTAEYFIEHLRAAHQHHDFANTRDQQCGEIEGVDRCLKKTFEPRQTCVLIFDVGGNCGGLCITEYLANVHLAAIDPQVADKFVRKLQPFGGAGVVIRVRKPVVGVKAALESVKEQPLLAEPDKLGEKLAIAGPLQAFEQFIHTLAVGVVLLERLGIVTGDVEQHPFCGGAFTVRADQ